MLPKKVRTAKRRRTVLIRAVSEGFGTARDARSASRRFPTTCRAAKRPSNSCEVAWLGGRDSNPDTAVQRAAHGHVETMCPSLAAFFASGSLEVRRLNGAAAHVAYGFPTPGRFRMRDAFRNVLPGVARPVPTTGNPSARAAVTNRPSNATNGTGRASSR